MAHHAAIDAIEHGPGFIVVSGWLAVTAGEAWPDPVLLRFGGERQPVSRWFERADLPDVASSGERFLAFHEDLPWLHRSPPPDGVALELPGGRTAAALGPEHWLRFKPAGHLEAVSQFCLSGWVFDPSLWRSGNGACRLVLDGTPLRPMRFSLARPDLPYGAALRGEALGFHLDARAAGEVVAGQQPFDGAPHRWALVTSGVEVAAIEHAIAPSANGRLEAHVEGRIQGWAAFPGQPELLASIDVIIDATRYATVVADGTRQDLRDRGVSTVGGQFAVPLGFSPSGTGEATVEAQVSGESRYLRGSPLLVAGLRIPRGAADAPWRTLANAASPPRVSVVVPVFNAAEDLQRCLEALIRHTRAGARLIIVDDASTDPQVTEVLASYRGRPGIEILVNPANLGFTRSCNRGIEAAGRDDVVLLNSDTIVPQRWLENLTVAARATPRTGSATPLSDNAGAFSAPEIGGANVTPHGLSASDVSRLVAQASIVSFPEVPTGHGFCLYLRRELLDAVGGNLDAEAFTRGYGEENDLCMRGLRAGFRHVLDDRTYVLHRQGASFGAERAPLLAAARDTLDRRYPEYARLVQALATDEAMLAVRWRVRRAFARTSAAPPRPRVLFVISTLTGGTPLTNLDLMRALEDRYEPWLLHSDRRELTVMRLAKGELMEVERRLLERPISLALHASEEYDQAVAELLLRHAIELVHIRHLAWHGLALPSVARVLGIGVVLSLHDFYVVCPTIKLLDERMEHCAGRCTPAAGECRAELWSASEVPPLKHRFVHRWRAMMRPALEACDALVTTSARTREIVLDAYPELTRRGIRVIPHGRSFPTFARPCVPDAQGGSLRVLVPGNLSTAKGAEILRGMAAADGGRRLEFHVLGDPGMLEPGPGLVLHGRYRREEFGARAEEIAPHLGAILSVWPETYCHTLTELWAAGLPVFALDGGAVGERIRAHGGGWLSASRDPRELLASLLAAITDPAGFARRLDEVRRWQLGAGAARDTHAMAADFDLLYREVAHARLAFAGTWTPPPVWLRVDSRAAATPPLALANRADAPVVFRAVAPHAAAAAGAAGGIGGVLLLGADGDVAWPDGFAEACAAAGLPLVLWAARRPPDEMLQRLALQPGGVLALPSSVAAGGAAAGVPMLDLDAPLADSHARLVKLARPPSGAGRESKNSAALAAPRSGTAARRGRDTAAEIMPAAGT